MTTNESGDLLFTSGLNKTVRFDKNGQIHDSGDTLVRFSEEVSISYDFADKHGNPSRTYFLEGYTSRNTKKKVDCKMSASWNTAGQSKKVKINKL